LVHRGFTGAVIVSVMVEEQGRQTADEKEGRKPWTLREFGGKTLWDWLQLLIVPVVLSLITVVFAWQQDIRQDQIESKRANAERELARERAQDEALQAYLSQMSSLLLEKDLRESPKDSEARTLARARTLTVLSRLNSDRKARLLQFLYEAGLLHKENRVIDLTGAYLSGIDLHFSNLSGGSPFLIAASAGFRTDKPSNAANLRGAILRDANLEDAVLSDTDLIEADLSEADLSHADLGGADLFTANLQEANLSNAHLAGADLSFARLKGADLSKADLTKEIWESRGGTTVPHARNDADMSYADLKNADLSDANLSGAKLTDTDLSDAHMSGVEGITNEELAKQTSKLEGAIMPDGSVSSVEFEPALSVRLSEEWEIPNEVSNEIYLYGKGGYLIFSKPRHVFDPSNPSEQKEVPAPENVDEWVSWFQSHPNLETSKLGPASVGGASGMGIDVALTSTPENYPQEVCQGTPCVPLYPLGHGVFGENMTIDSEGYNKYRFNIVDVGGETVVIHATAQTDKFDEFLPKAQKVLDTVKWQE
jgi:uncharacterized protein YjbI with pentapeptide repeats